MITLYKYIRESIFDDDEEVLDNSASNSINNELKELDQLFISRHGVPRHGEPQSSIKNDTLFLLDINTKHIDTEVYNKIKDIKDISKFTNINNKGVIIFDTPVINSSLCDEIICPRMRFGKNVNTVKDIRLTLDNRMSYYGYMIQTDGSISFQNVEFKCNVKDEEIDTPSFTFKNIPTFKNCRNYWGIKRIYIGDPDNGVSFNDQEIIKRFNNFLDDKHISNYQDSKITDKYYKRKGDLKTLITTIKTHKKYIFNSSETGKCFGIKSNAKLKDILDVDGFKDLFHICFTDKDNNIRINFYSGEVKLNAKLQRPNCVKLPNDDWYMIIENKKLI